MPNLQDTVVHTGETSMKTLLSRESGSNDLETNDSKTHLSPKRNRFHAYKTPDQRRTGQRPA